MNSPYVTLFDYAYCLFLGGGPAAEDSMDEEKRRHLSLLNAKDLEFDNGFDLESNDYNRTRLQKIQPAAAATATSGLYNQQEQLVTLS